MNLPQEFKDRKGEIIKARDILIRWFYARWRERPGHKRVAIEGMSGLDVIIPDEGRLEKAQTHWAKYLVKWSGACLIAEMIDCSDYQSITQAELFDEKGQQVHVAPGFYYFNKVFDSMIYEIVRRTDGKTNQTPPG